ncbi:MAG: hypothetical protein HMLKMBBP_00054 [Planctomycetes bacterium]|nr:hypothetical protein [Planctomycetota bacterium]
MTRPLGQDAALRAFDAAIATGRIAGAYLLHGPPGTGRMLGARSFAAALLCTSRRGSSPCGTCRACRDDAQGRHPDLLVVQADRGPRFDDDADADRAQIASFTASARAAEKPQPRKTIPVRTLRKLVDLTALAPSGGGWKVVILDAFDEVEDEGAALLLKTLEEAPRQTTFLILARGTEAVPDTILSRCQRVRFRPLAPDMVRRIVRSAGGAAAQAVPAAALDRLVALGQGSAGRTLRAIEWDVHGGAIPPADRMLAGDALAVDGLVDWVRAAGRDLDAQRERTREALALLLHGLRGDAATASGEARIAAIRHALESVESNVSPELALRALGVRWGAAGARDTASRPGAAVRR